MICGIYKITNKINGKVYIGQSRDIKQRWRREKSGAFSPGNVDYNCSRSKAFRKYGIENFTFEVIEECSIEALNEKEKYWANYYNSYVPNGYNEALCGDYSSHTTSLKNIGIVKQIIFDLKNTTLSGIELGHKYGVSDQTISDINNGRSWRFDEEKYPIRSRIRKVSYCKNCGKEITYGHNYCKTCADICFRKVERPDKMTLLKEIATTSFVAVGKKYGVSDKAITKWCAAYGLPTHKKELKELYNSLEKKDL